MNQHVKQLWIKALRSGKYKQARRRLRRDIKSGVRMCCLGVLCEVYRKTEKRGQWIHDKKGWAFVLDSTSAITVTHKTVWLWAGLPDDNPKIDSWDSLAELNDGGKDFNFIADKIEARL